MKADKGREEEEGMRGSDNQPKRGIASQVLLRRGQRHSKAKLDIAIVNKWNGKGGEEWGGEGELNYIKIQFYVNLNLKLKEKISIFFTLR